MLQRERDSSLDIIRILAAFMVISVHAMAKMGFYNIAISGKHMMLMVAIRQMLMCCVPLFMLLTGYLMNRKQLSRRYYSGISRTLGIYVLVSTVALIYRIYIGETYSPKTFILDILRFECVPYAWYIEMYIGLFLLIPFLNLIYHHLEGKRQKLWLIFTFIAVTSLPFTLNTFDLTSNGWQHHLLDQYGSQKLIPDYWSKAYPLLYYFIGCYLSEYPIRVKNRFLIPIAMTHGALYGIFVYFKNGATTFTWTDLVNYGSLGVVISSVLIFSIVKNIDTHKWNNKIKGCIKYIAGLSLGTYLVSWVVDSILYPHMCENISDPMTKLDLFLPMALLVFLTSSMLSAGVNLVYDFIQLVCRKIKGLYSPSQGYKNPE